MIPESTLTQILERVDIVEVIAAHVPLRNAGKNFKANCPFHHEKTPSFMVNPDKQIFHCFGCNAGGNVFTFLMKFEKKDFREVVEALADRAGVEIEPEKNSRDASQYDDLWKANRLAAELYQKILWKEERGAQARAYLKARGLSEDTIREFGLGFAPDAWDTVKKALSPDVGEKVLEQAGLVLPGKDSKTYDRFRNRIMFPILEGKGRTVAFGGRVLDESQPKYMNSPETPIYTKGRQLYGLFQARTAIRTEDLVVMVEGYMDVIGCHQAGVTNVVASLGTALTNDQARLLKRHTNRAVILYDADAAGEMATLRGLEIFLEEGMDVKIVRLPEGFDPDTYILKHGLDAFRKELSEAKDLFDYKLALLKTKFSAKTVDGRVKIANEMVSLFSKVKNEMLRSAWSRELAAHLGISEEAVTAEIARSKKVFERGRAQETVPARVAETAIRPAEKILLGLLIESADFTQRAGQRLNAGDFGNPVFRKVLGAVLDETTQREFQSRFWMGRFQQDAEAAEILAMAIAESEKAPDKEKAFEDCLGWIERSKMGTIRDSLRAQLDEAHRSGDQDRLRQLLQDFNQLNKGMKKSHEKS